MLDVKSTLFEENLNPSSYFFWILLLTIISLIIIYVIRSFSTYFKFVYPNAKYEAIGNPYTTEKELNKIVESKDITSFKDLIKKSINYEVNGNTISEIQQSLDKHYIQTIEMMRKDSSKKMNDFFDLYIEKFDTFLIKNVIKKKLYNEEIDEKIIEYAIKQKTKKLLSRLIDSKKDEIPTILKNHDYTEEILNIISNEKVNFLSLDIALDKNFINKFKQLKVPRKCEIAKQKFVNYLIDTTNIKNVLRAKHIGYSKETCYNLFLGEGQELADWRFKQICESNSVADLVTSIVGTSYYNTLKDFLEYYNKEKSVQILENALDIQFLKLLRDLSVENYITIGPTLRFIVLKEFEIKNLKIVAKGIYEGLPIDLIKKFVIMEN
jgi:V/A-type H+-transporting ATPase subunit C